MDELTVLLEIRQYLEIFVGYGAFVLFFLLPAFLLGLLFWWFWRSFMR